MGPLFEPVCAAMHFVNLCRPCVDFRCVPLNAVPLRYTGVYLSARAGRPAPGDSITPIHAAALKGAADQVYCLIMTTRRL